MPYDLARVGTSWTDRLRTVPNRVSLVAVIVAAVVSVHGLAHGMLAPASHLQSSMPAVSIVLWGVTTIVALGGLVGLGWAYVSVISHLEAEPRIDLEILPADERHLLGPVIETPGITQVEIVDRSGYSDAKVSQTLKALRERGLVYREPQGRTYRLYPGTMLASATNED